MPQAPPASSLWSIPDAVSPPCWHHSCRVTAKHPALLIQQQKHPFFKKTPKTPGLCPPPGHSPGRHHNHQDVLLPHHAPKVTVGVFQRPCGGHPPKPDGFGQSSSASSLCQPSLPQGTNPRVVPPALPGATTSLALPALNESLQLSTKPRRLPSPPPPRLVLQMLVGRSQGLAQGQEEGAAIVVRGWNSCLLPGEALLPAGWGLRGE